MEIISVKKPGRLFFQYVLQNVFGMIGMSAYILADTFFISLANGANGIATLNLVLPVYSIIFAIGAMIGGGGATRYMIDTASGRPLTRDHYSNSILWAAMIGTLFAVAGLTFPDAILSWMGGDETILRLGVPYLRIIMCFAPLFMIEHILGAFTRNDGAPTVAMAGLLSSSLFNVLFDYILMFPLGLGMRGAALATAFSPVVDMMICMTHILSRRSNLKFRLIKPSAGLLLRSCQLGIPSFIGEIASGITTLVFNTLLLRLAGNNGVAAYGVIANISIVIIAIFNGVAQGSQPLVSYYCGTGETSKQKTMLVYSILFSVAVALVVIAASLVFPDAITRLFNHEQNQVMQSMAVEGMRIYFTGMLFAGINIVGASYFSAIGDSFWSSLISVLRGIVAIVFFAMFLSRFFGMIGVWMAFPAAELFTLFITVRSFIRTKRAA